MPPPFRSSGRYQTPHAYRQHPSDAYQGPYRKHVFIHLDPPEMAESGLHLLLIVGLSKDSIPSLWVLRVQGHPESETICRNTSPEELYDEPSFPWGAILVACQSMGATFFVNPQRLHRNCSVDRCQNFVVPQRGHYFIADSYVKSACYQRTKCNSCGELSAILRCTSFINRQYASGISANST